MPGKEHQMSVGEFAILEVLRLRDRQYGLEIKASVEALRGRRIPVSGVYTTLKRFERRGYVRGSFGSDTESPEASRRYYFLTDSGRQAIEREREIWLRILYPSEAPTE